MGAVGLLARKELRRRWRGTVVVALLIGIVGALVMAALAGARRSDSALARFTATTRSADVSLLPAFLYRPTAAEARALRRLPQVDGVAILQSYAITVAGAPPTLGPSASVDGAIGNVIDRDQLLAGRQPNPKAVDEVAIGETLSTQLHQGVGGHIDATSYSQKQLLHYALLPGPYPLGDGPRLRFRIVGIVRHRLDLGVFAATGGVLVMTPAFDRAYASRIGQYGAIIRVRTKHGSSDLPAVLAGAKRIFAKSGPVSTQGVSTETEGAGSAIDVVALALRILAGVAAVAGAVTVAIMLSREANLAGFDNSTLRTLGLTTRQRVLTSAVRVLVIAAGGVLVAFLGALALSPRFPVGIARRADPDIGFHVDWLTLLSGVGLLVLTVLTISLIAALRNVRRPDTASVFADQGRPRLVATAGALPPSVASGLRLALDPGRGRTAVPVRSACFGAVLGVLGVVAVLVFGASLDHLTNTPRLSGWTFDFVVPDNNFSPFASTCDRADFDIHRIRGVTDVAAVCDSDIQLDGRPVTAFGVTPIRGNIAPYVVEGRGPRSHAEVALGSKTLKELHKHIGDTVLGPKPKARRYRIVGTVVLPTLAFLQPLADGALFSGAGLLDVFDKNSRGSRNLIGRLAPGADHAAVLAEIAGRQPRTSAKGPALPVEIEHVRDVAWIARTLAALLAALALVAVGHALMTATRRRRRELAMLKTLGFVRSQVRATVAWQATILAAIGLIIGIPLGVTLGRFAWHLVSDGLGVAAVYAIPLTLLILAPAALLAVNLLAFIPARRAARIEPGPALRLE